MGGGRCARAAHCASRAFVNGAAGGAKKNREKSRFSPACDVRVPGARLPGRDDVCARCVSGYEDFGDMYVWATLARGPWVRREREIVISRWVPRQTYM